MNKRLVIALMVLFSCVGRLWAQENNLQPTTIQPVEADLLASPTVPQAVMDSLALPSLTQLGTVAHRPYTSGYAGWNCWDLHAGLNASLSASAFFGLGSHGGAGVAESLSLMYAGQLAPKLTFAVGGHFTNLDWSGRNYRTAGLTALLGYRFDEHWEAYIFAEKSVMTPKMPQPLYAVHDIGDKIGAAVRYNFSPSFSVHVSVWNERFPMLVDVIRPIVNRYR